MDNEDEKIDQSSSEDQGASQESSDSAWRRPVDTAQNIYKTGKNVKQGIEALRGLGGASHAAEGLYGGAAGAEGAAATGEAGVAGAGMAGAGAEGAATAAGGATLAGEAGAVGAAGAGAGAAAGGAATAAGAAGATGTAAAGTAVAATPVGWIAAGIAIIVVLIILFFFIIKGGGGSSDNDVSAQNQAGGNGGNGSVSLTCGGQGSLDYSLPLKDTTVLPQNVADVQQQIENRWPNAALYNWQTIVDESVNQGWNPSLLLALWIEESGAQGAPNYTDALGCDPSHPTKDIKKSLACVFNSFTNVSDFEQFMCLYGGDAPHTPPCSFSQNPNFVPNVKDWYSRLVPSGPGAVSAIKACTGPGGIGDWPTAGIIYQGPQGASDHAGLYSQGLEAVDIANPAGPPVYSSFDGIATIHNCVDAECFQHYGNYIDVTSPNGTARYGHLAQINVSDGQTVKAGEQIGIMGSTGNSTGIHLHWEFRAGLKMEPPNIPSAITPFDCDNDLGPVCSNPSSVSPGSTAPPNI